MRRRAFCRTSDTGNPPGASGTELVFEHRAAVDADEAETSQGAPVVGSGP